MPPLLIRLATQKLPLLEKVADAAKGKPTLYGQEKDSVTAGLARMNMILHENATAEIMAGNTLTSPKWTNGNKLKQFDYVVAVSVDAN